MHAATATIFTLPMMASLAGAASPDAAATAAVRASAKAGLQLVWIDPTGAVGLYGAAAREEARRVFEAMGVLATWRRGRAEEAARAGEVRVILLDRAPKETGAGLVLGATPARSEGGPLVWIDVGGIRQALGIAGPDATLGLGDVRRFRVALGRVIAHEVVHAVAPEVPHGEGLMAARLNARALTAPVLEIPAGVGRAVRLAATGGGTAVPDTGASPRQSGVVAARHAWPEHR